MDIRAVLFRSGHEKRVGDLFSPPGAGPSPGVLLLHGFPGVQKNEDMAAELCRRGFVAFVPHFAGSWGSGGRYTIAGLFKDARTALQLLGRYPQVDRGRLGLIGLSVGGWLALRLASEKLVKAAAVLAPKLPEPLSAAEARYVRLNSRVIHMADRAALLKEYERAARGDLPEAYIPKIAPTPLLFVQGLKDGLVAPESTRRLWALAGGPKALVELPTESHEFQEHREEVVETVCDWMENVLVPTAEPRAA